MTVAANYRATAPELLTRADGENQTMKDELERLAAAYLRLAERAERNIGLTVEFELPSEKAANPKQK
jgi:hypothetical protein